MMRFARAGPMRGRRTRDSAGAVSKSSGVEGVDEVDGSVLEGGSLRVFALDPPEPLDPFDALEPLALSTAAI